MDFIIYYLFQSYLLFILGSILVSNKVLLELGLLKSVS